MSHPIYALPVEITYDGSDGQRHYARITALHDDGTVTLSRGYYGTSRTRITAADRPYYYGTNEPYPTTDDDDAPTTSSR